MNRYSKSKHAQLYRTLARVDLYGVVLIPDNDLRGARAAVLANKASYATGLIFRTHTVEHGTLFVRVE